MKELSGGNLIIQNIFWSQIFSLICSRNEYCNI